MSHPVEVSASFQTLALGAGLPSSKENPVIAVSGIVALGVMYQLVYVSTATKRFSADELFDLLPKYREKNARLRVTGLLLYKLGTFMQLLEGKEETVRSLYDTICEDERHYKVHPLLKITVRRRQFPDWSMGFEDLGTEAAKTVQGFKPLRELPPWVDILPWKASVAMKLLATFNQGE